MHHLFIQFFNVLMQKTDPYKTVLVILTGLLIVNWIFKNPYLQFVSIGLGLICVFFSRVAVLIDWLWIKLALGLGWINSRILLTLIFFLFLLPVAWVSRLFVKDPLNLKRRKESLYINRNHKFQKKDLENIW